MSDQTAQLQIPTLVLPPGAPRVRVTAGSGSATQKTWNLRRPITLIGSRRPAHIVLHDRDISHAHCVIVNTGTEVLLKDLHTSAGTICNKDPIDLTTLSDGDVITVGSCRIQVAIQVLDDACDDSASGIEFADPLSFPTPVTVGLLHTDQEWTVSEAVTLIGRHDLAPIRLDHDDVARRHAVIFRFGDEPAIFDLVGRDGLLVNSRRCTLSTLKVGYRMTLGPFGLRVGRSDEAPPEVEIPALEIPSPPPERDGKPPVDHAFPRLPKMPAPGVGDSEGPAALDSELDKLRNDITESWEQLNSWQSRLLADATEISQQESDLAARAGEFEARDAEVRGKLHDITCLHEQLVVRERELAAEVKRLRSESEHVEQARDEQATREVDLTRRAEELSRREHVFAQRWTRMRTAKCAACGAAFSTAGSED